MPQRDPAISVTNEEFFGLSGAYAWGAGQHSHINNYIEGRLASYEHTCGILAEIIQKSSGHHLEIGALYGGTAILAAMAMDQAKRPPEDQVVVVDPLTANGYYGGNDNNGVKPSAEIFYRNVKQFKVFHRITFFDEPSYPWIQKILDTHFGSAFIDGDHTLPAVAQDWSLCKDRVNDFVMIDNVDLAHPDIVNVHDQITRDEDWRLVHMLGIVTVYQSKYSIRKRIKELRDEFERAT